ncbi:MAG: sugar phosphate nucleotidyltransferase, partial [Rickettsiales bacterium]|nr:sugar phosphate nucleotidyltransferase [Rickettsiales bacterium]
MKAIILAAGKGERLKPFTDTLPKPLFPINNETLLERIIKYLLSKNINDIFIITGYKNEKLQFLKRKYKTIKLIHNNNYDKYNNFYSLLKAEKELNDDCLVLAGDIYINNDFLKNFKNPDKSLIFVQNNNSNCKEWEVIFD